MTDTSNLDLPRSARGGARKLSDLNRAIKLIDGSVQIYVLAIGENTPPPNPSEDDTYIVGDSPTGFWSGYAGKVARFADDSWFFITPKVGWSVSTSPDVDSVSVRSLTENGDWVSVSGETGYRGWSPVDVEEVISPIRTVKKLSGFTGGQGVAPTTNVGKYYGPDGTFVDDAEDAINKNAPEIYFDAVEYEEQERLNDVALLSIDLNTEKTDRRGFLEQTASPYIFQSIGRQVTPVTGDPLGSRTYVMGSPALQDGYISALRVHALDDGVIYIKRFTRSDNDWTRVGSDYEVVVESGDESLGVDRLPYIPLLEGEHLGFYAPGIISVTDGLSAENLDQGSFFNSSSGGNFNTFTASTASTDTRIEIGFDVAATSTAYMQASSSVDEGLAHMLAPQTETFLVIGRPSNTDPATGLQIGTRTYVFGTALTYDGYASRIKAYSEYGGMVVVKRMEMSGTDKVKVPGTPDYYVRLNPGLNNLTPDKFGHIPVEAGELIAIYPNRAVSYISATGDSGGYYDAAGNADTVTDTSLTTNIQIQFSIEFDRQKVTDTRVAAIETDVDTLTTAISDVTTTVYGRSSTPVAGSSSSASVRCYGTPVAVAGELRRVMARANGDGTLTVGAFTRSGDTFTPVRQTSTALLTGDNDITLGTPIDVNVGEYVGWWASTIIDFTSTTGDSGGYYSSSTAGALGSFTDASLTTNVRMEIRFEIDTTTLLDVAAELEALNNGAGAVASDTEIVASQRVGTVDRLNIHGHGQSNDIARDSDVVTTTPSIRHLTFSEGVSATKPGISGGNLPDDGTFKFLVSETLDPDGGGDCGETQFPTLAKDLFKRSVQTTGAAPTIFASAAGKGGTGISGIGYGAAWYQNLRYHMHQAFDKAVLDGVASDRIAVFVAFDHGETDQINSVAKATVKGGIIALIDGFKADFVADTLSSKPINWFFTSSCYEILTSSGHTDAVLELCAPVSLGGRPDCHYVAPDFIFARENDTHYSATGQMHKGLMVSRAMSQVLQNRKPDRCRFIGASALTTALQVWVEGPSSAPVSLVTKFGGATTNRGFRVYDDTGDLTLSGISVGTGVTDPASGLLRTPINITLSRELDDNPVVQYCRDYKASGCNIQNGASGDVYAVTGETDTVNSTSVTLDHPLHPLSATIQILE